MKRAAGFLAMCAIAVICFYWLGDKPDSEPIYVDVVSELERQELHQVEGSELYIAKVDKGNNLSVPVVSLESASNGETHSSISVRMPYQGGIYTLVFQDDALVGYYPPDSDLGEHMAGIMQTDEETIDKLYAEYLLYIETFTEKKQEAGI